MSGEFRISDLRKRKGAGTGVPAQGTRPNPTPLAAPMPASPAPPPAHMPSAPGLGAPPGLPQPGVLPGQMPHGHGPQSGQSFIEDISLRQYWQVVVRYRLIVCLIAIAVATITAISAMFEPDMYRASATMITQEPIRHRNLNLSSQNFYVETFVQLARSMPVRRNAAQRVHEELLTLEAGGTKVPTEDKKLARHFGPGDMSAYASLDTSTNDMIYITATTEMSRTIVAAMANALAEALKDELQKLQISDSTKKENVLRKLEKLKLREIEDLEAQIAVLRKNSTSGSAGLVMGSLGERSANYRYEQLELQLQQAELEREAVNEEIQATQESLDVSHLKLSEIEWVTADNQMSQKLQNLKAEREEMLTRYTEENPALVKLDEQISALDKVIGGRNKNEMRDGKHVIYVPREQWGLVSSVIRNQSRIKGIDSKIQALKARVARMRKDLIDRPVDLLPIERLTQRKHNLEQLLNDLRRDYERERIEQAANYANLEILEKAYPPGGPFAPNRKKRAVVGIMLGLALGIAAAFLLNNWDNTIKGSNDIKRSFTYPCLGVIPRWEAEDSFISALGPDSNIAEVYGVLRNNIRYSSVNSPEKCFMIASALQDEGKSHISMNLAISFAIEGNRVLLLCSDMRAVRSYTDFRPRSHIHINTGLSDYLDVKCSRDEVIIPSTIDNMDIIPSGARAQNPARLLKTSRFRELLEWAQRDYDVVIVDTPAVLPVVDATIVANMVRGIMMVCQANRTPLGAVQQAVARIEHVRGPIIGMTLNKVKDVRSDYFYGPNYNYQDKAYKTSDTAKLEMDELAMNDDRFDGENLSSELDDLRIK